MAKSLLFVILLSLVLPGDSNRPLSQVVRLSGYHIFPLSLFDSRTCKLSHVTEALTPKICVNQVTQS